MIKTFFIALVCFCTCSFAAVPSDVAGVDAYILRLRKILPSVPAGCFLNVCNRIRDFKEIQLVPGTYYFVNKTHVAECPMIVLQREFGVGAYGNLRSILKEWMSDRQDRFASCYGDESQIQEHRKFLVYPGIAMGLYERESFLKTCLNNCEPARGRPRERLEETKPSLLSKKFVVPAVFVAEKPAEVSAAQPKIDHVEETAFGAFPAPVVELPTSKEAAKSTETEFAEIVNGLTSAQLVAIDQRYAGTGMTFEGKYTKACTDGLFEELSGASSPRKRSVSRSPSRPKTVESVCAARVSSPSPSRIRPLKVVFETKKVEQTYTDFFRQQGNSAASLRFLEFVRTVSIRGLLDYIGRSAPFLSMPGVFKLPVGDKARILYYRGEGDSIVLIGDPAHYGD